MNELRRFKVVTINEEKINKFNELVDSKNLSREDLILILSTITLNSDIFQQDLSESLLKNPESSHLE